MSQLYTAKRSALRRYMRDTVILATGFPRKRVVSSRFGDVFMSDELPVIDVSMNGVESTVYSGSNAYPHAYQDTEEVVVTIVLDEFPNTPYNKEVNDSVEYLDTLVEQVTKKICLDPFMFLRVEGAVPDDQDTWHLSLATSVHRKSATFGKLSQETGRRVIGATVNFSVTHIVDVVNKRKFEFFNEYYMRIVRVDSTEETVDRTLISGEGYLS